MKKNSKSGGERHPAETIGVDLGAGQDERGQVHAVLNEEGVVVEEGSFRNNAESIAKHFGERGKARVALVNCSSSAWDFLASLPSGATKSSWRMRES